MEITKSGYARFMDEEDEEATSLDDIGGEVRRIGDTTRKQHGKKKDDVGLTLGFPLAKSNLALIEAGIAKAPVVRKTGTTIVAAVYKGGVVMGGDSRSTAGNLIADKQVLKVHKLSKSIYACGAGTAADLDQVTKWLSMLLQLDELNTGRPSARVAMAVTQAAHHLYKYKGHIGAQLLIGGVDCKGAHLYSCSSHGSTQSLCFDAEGSGGYAAISILERGFKVDMTENECKALVQEAIETGMHGDNASGNSYNLVVIDSDGARFLGPYTPKFATRSPASRSYMFETGATQVLKEGKGSSGPGIDFHLGR